MKPASPFETLVANLQRRPGMFVYRPTYSSVVAYLCGFDHGRRTSGNVSDLDEFTEWLYGEVGHHFAAHWSAAVCDLFADGDEEKALPTLFALLREFNEERAQSEPSTNS